MQGRALFLHSRPLPGGYTSSKPRTPSHFHSLAPSEPGPALGAWVAGVTPAGKVPPLRPGATGLMYPGLLPPHHICQFAHPSRCAAPLPPGSSQPTRQGLPGNRPHPSAPTKDTSCKLCSVPTRQRGVQQAHSKRGPSSPHSIIAAPPSGVWRARSRPPAAERLARCSDFSAPSAL